MNKQMVTDLIRMMDEVEDWYEQLPIYYSDMREILEGYGYDTSFLHDTDVDKMFNNIVFDVVDGTNWRGADVDLDGLCSTCEVMWWILMHGCPELECTHFRFKDDRIKAGLFQGVPRSLVVSKTKLEDWGVELPVEHWHEPVDGMKRIMIGERYWLACINGEYYYISS